MTIEISDGFELDFFRRRALSKGLSYCVPVNPYPGECLEDLLIRAACENGFHPAMSHQMLAIPRQRKSPGGNGYKISAQALATLLGNRGGPQELECLLQNTVPPQKYLKPFFDVWVHKITLRLSRRVSPLALRKAPFLRAMWRVWPLGFDTETKESLIETCPVCRKLLLATFMGDVWCCDRCAELTSDGQLSAVDLREYPQPLVSEDLWENLDFATSFIDPTRQDQRAISRRRLHGDFENVSDGDVFEMVHALARLMSGYKSKNGPFEPTVLNAAAETVLGWPEALEKMFADRDARTVDSPYAKNILYNNRIDPRLRHRIKESLQRSGMRPILRSFVSSDVLRTPLPFDEYSCLKKYIDRGYSNVDSTVHSTAIVLRSKALIRELAVQVGLSVPTIMAIADLDIFPGVLDESPDSPEEAASYLGSLVRRLTTGSCTSMPPADAIRLPRVVAALFNRIDDPWGRVLQAILAGDIEYWFVDRSTSSILERVYVEDLTRLIDILKNGKEVPSLLHTVPLTRREAASSMRLQQRGLIVAEAAGILKAPFTREELVRFRLEFEPSSLLSIRHTWALKTSRGRRPLVRSMLLAAGIKPVIEFADYAHIWRRSDVDGHFGGRLIVCIE